ncbi:tRNA (adenosine(37)-N6)-threonylcarbamoyltransferase complex ATPase subunit type 1 TsaE [Candidatus Peregrinibacteria bacterium]|nr:tRNA (adenosine(37)-N6)-threonylcarbamoyltransferase complex ATPase subunit type 1 TsaE [Candidatus Peregrinibacteria bacterium]
MTDSAQIWLPDAEITYSCGASLRDTLYGPATTIWLDGELGAGKTTLLQGLLQSMGVPGPVTSPTYALEQRYTSGDGMEILHIDLYRLKQADADKLIAESDDFTGLRCIEWAERLSERAVRAIRIHLAETDRPGRVLNAEFEDIPLPSLEDISRWRTEAALPGHIVRHCDAVANLCDLLGNALLERGILLRPLALRRAAEVHDLLRFLDFKHGKALSDEPISDEQIATWNVWKNRYPGMRHEEGCAAFLRDEGFDALAEIVAVHGLMQPSPERVTIEQRLLFYADKRVRLDEVVTLDERFDDFRKRYGNGQRSHEGDIWLAEAKATERELFPDGLPV